MQKDKRIIRHKTENRVIQRGKRTIQGENVSSKRKHIMQH